MNVYMDLSFLLQMLLGYSSLYFVKTLLVNKPKVYLVVIFTILNGFTILLVYLHLFLAVLIYLIYVSIFLILIFKKDFLKSLFLYLFCFSLLTFIIDKLSNYNTCYNFILTINSPQGILSYLFGPLFLIGLVVSTKIVDSLFRLHDFKSSCYLIKNGKKVYYSCYFDSGNSLRYKNIPVIFINKDNYPFIKEEQEEIEIKGINSLEKRKIETCLLQFEDRKESYFVYVALVDVEEFHGCEILLNAYLQ